MFAMPGMRSFSVSSQRDPARVSCTDEGVFIGDVPLLKKQGSAGRHPSWSVRPIAELNGELTACYGLPVDIAGKTGALALIAQAFNRGDLAMATIAAVQMQFPDPPPPVRRAESFSDAARRAEALARSGLLKFWDPALHPRAGVPPNPGWFASDGQGSEGAPVVPVMTPDHPWDKPWDNPATVPRMPK